MPDPGIQRFSTYPPVLRIRILLDPFHFGLDPGSKKLAKIMENFHKNKPKSSEYRTFFKNNKLMFNGHEYLPNK